MVFFEELVVCGGGQKGKAAAAVARLPHPQVLGACMCVRMHARAAGSAAAPGSLVGTHLPISMTLGEISDPS